LASPRKKTDFVKTGFVILTKTFKASVCRKMDISEILEAWVKGYKTRKSLANARSV